MNRLSCAVIIACGLLMSTSLSQAYAEQRPFWTEKTTFIEGNTLYAVGVTTNSRKLEEGRELAFQRGRFEVMNYAQIANLRGTGITLETQMTYEEQNRDGSYNVYRLLKTDVRKLMSVQKAQQNTTQARMKELNHIMEVNRALTESFVTKRLEIAEAKSQIDTTKEELALFAHKGKVALAELESLKQRALKKQIELEQIYRTMEEGKSDREAILHQMENAKKGLDAQQIEIEKLYNEIKHRILTRSENAKKYIMNGMTMEEVVSLLGAPDAKSEDGNYWYYRSTVVGFNSYTKMVNHVSK